MRVCVCMYDMSNTYGSQRTTVGVGPFPASGLRELNSGLVPLPTKSLSCCSEPICFVISFSERMISLNPCRHEENCLAGSLSKSRLALR